MKQTAVVLALAALAACSATGPSDNLLRVYTVEVEPHLGECNNAFVTVPCLLLREHNQGPVRGHLWGVNGFTFVWGNRYQLRISEYRIPNPPADGASRRYELEEVISVEPIAAGTEFTFNAWPGSRSILRGDGAHLDMFLGLPVACGEDCEAMREAIDAEHRFEMTLRHTGIPSAPVGIVAWRSCPATVNPNLCDA